MEGRGLGNHVRVLFCGFGLWLLGFLSYSFMGNAWTVEIRDIIRYRTVCDGVSPDVDICAIDRIYILLLID